MSLVQAVDVIIMAFATKLSPLIEEMPGRAEELFTLFRKEKP